ncbi:succinyl-diaminopimelate desuccinylase [Apilactobacillus ozensis DSM 23829 = JCM 17196]|uniref:Succinyl-diaminopimelate desuccinylase n=1 Tax=Apilactobacillus ozensis DSM 23829 = JCM 17196 TaxID=1423781 RepID=A0A0R2AWE2_9LACO|nr:M20/M25/M40 family metallo-hydrolase [Apilactobacillus ozensis]KRM69876.1 succinyl-diaminopimelate desuccinylase [Apilactobacillus ozensis DSM 23829 = JCM 17196]
MKKNEKLQILRDLVKINTVNNYEETVAIYVKELLSSYGISSSIIKQAPKRSNLVAEIINNDGPVLGLSGHMDIVSEGDVDSWKTDPFELVEQDGKLYGRGTSDMKAGVVDLIIAFIELSMDKFNGNVRLLLTISEELTEEGAKYLSDLGYGDDLKSLIIAEPTGVSTDSLKEYVNSDGVKINSELKQTLLAKSDLNVFDEQHFIITAHKGWMTYTVTSTGKAAHSSMPSMGINAIDNLVKYYLAEKVFYNSLTEYDEDLGYTVYAPDIIRGGKQVNSIPDKAYLQVKVRTIPQLPNEELIERLQAIINRLNQQPGVNLSLKVEYNECPVKCHNNTDIVEIFQNEAKLTLGEAMPLPQVGVSLGTDASEFRRNNPNLDIVIVGPGNTTAHQANEYVDLETFYNMTDLYFNVVVKFFEKNLVK